MVDHAPDACSRRGGDGLALLLHTAGPAALGGAGAGLGYAGLANGIALEFDTWADADVADPGDNHVAVITRGDLTLRRVFPIVCKKERSDRLTTPAAPSVWRLSQVGP